MLSLARLAIILLLCLLPLVSADVQAKRTNLFQANLRKRVNPDDELLKRALWATARAPPSIKAQDKPPKFKPLIGLPTCLKCAGKRKHETSLSYDDFTAAKLVNKIVLGGMTGACMFYGQRPPPEQCKPGTPFSYSEGAEELACAMSGTLGMGKTRSIWGLFPSDEDKSCEWEKNYYCLRAFKPICCWLNPFMSGDTKAERELGTRPYFQQMSLAMALTCTGEAFVISEFPDNINYQYPGQNPSIWLTHELPALQRLYKLGEVTKLTVIPANTNTGKIISQNRANWRDVTNILSGARLKRGFEWTEELTDAIKKVQKHNKSVQQSPNNATDHMLQERWGLCAPSVAAQEESGSDYFG